MPLTASADIYPTHPDVITVDCSFHVKDVVKRIPGARWSTARRTWAVPLSWGSCLALRTEFGSELVVGAALKEWASDKRTHHAKMTSLRSSLEPSEDFIDGDEPGWRDLFPYQRAGSELVKLANGRYFILDETGCGKSRTALAAIAKLDDPFPVMIVAPKSMLRTWEKETHMFFGSGALDVRVVTGTPKQRANALEPGGHVYVVSYSTLRQHSRLSGYGKAKLTDAQREPKELNAIEFRTALVDEAHRAKNPSAAQTRALWAAAGDAPYRIVMTGTPIQENAEDLWALLHFVEPSIFTSKSTYSDRYLNTEWNRWGGREVTGLKPSTRDEFFAVFDAMSRRITKDAALPFLPPKLYEVRWVELPPKLRKAYNSMQKDLIAELETTTLAASSVLERAGRLLQLANSSGEVDADGVYHMTLPSPKVEAFLDDLAAGDFDEQSVVVFSDSRQLIDLLSSELARLDYDHLSITGDVTGDDRQAAMDKFQAGEVKLLLLTRAGGEGITLTKASTMVRLVRSWSHTVHRQSEDRVHRIGSEQHTSVTYVDYVSAATVEEGQLIRLNSKEATAQEVLRDRDLLTLLE